MADKPLGMYRNGRPRIAEIAPNIRLFRRVSPDDWGDPHVDVDALDIPDMSVNLGRPVGEPEWVLFEEEEHASWGIVFFEAGDVPTPMKHQNGNEYTFVPHHVPHDENYPHSEIWMFIADVRVQSKKTMDKDFSLRWRNALLMRTRNYKWPA